MSAEKNAIGKEQVAKLVDDTRRKIQISGATDPAWKGQGASGSSNVKIIGDKDDSFQSDANIRCLCGNTLETDALLKCGDRRCQVWQHVSCVIIPEKPMESVMPVPDNFYCEICRLSRADPFWDTVAHPLFPVKMIITNHPTDGSNPVQSVERTFQLTTEDKDLVSKQEVDVQAWCMLLNDKVSFRMQWPQYTDLQINGDPVHPTNRSGSQLLGANGRDDGAIITPYTKDGINKIYLGGCDARIFCLGVRIVRRRSLQQILNMIPKESEGERFEDALARFCRRVGSGNVDDNAGSDSDLEVVSDTFSSIDLCCPISSSRMKIAGRFKPCIHVGCFDLEVFVVMNQRSRKWQCPICLKDYALDNIIIDPYFNRITSMMMNCGEDVKEVEVRPGGCWRVKAMSESECLDSGNLAQWHFPDGSLCVSTDGEVRRKEALNLVKQEGVSDSQTSLKIDMRMNSDGDWAIVWEGSASGDRLKEVFENDEQLVIPISSSATGSGPGGDDASVNQGGGGGGGHIDYSTANGIEMDSPCPQNVDLGYGYTPHNTSAQAGGAEVIVLSDSDDDPCLNNVDLGYRYAAHNTSAQAGRAEVIVLSDSDDDNGIFVSSATADNNNQTAAAGDGYLVPPSGIVDSYAEEHNSLGKSGLRLFPNEDDFGSWPLPSGNQAGPGFQLFGSDADVSDALVHLQHGPPVNCSSSLNGYALDPDTALGPGSLMPDSSAGRADADMNVGLVDNPVAFAGDDPSLQNFLPTRPAESSAQHELRNQVNVSNGVCTEDWISLSLGGGTVAGNGDACTQNGLNSGFQIPPREGSTNTNMDDAGLRDSTFNYASLLLGMNDARSDKASRQRSDIPFSFPRRKRSTGIVISVQFRTNGIRSRLSRNLLMPDFVFRN